jgi:hypothetical protein
MVDETGKVADDLNVDMVARANLFWIALLLSLAGGGIYFMVENTERLLAGISMFGLSLLLFSTMDDDGRAPKLWLSIFERFASASTVVLIIAAVLCTLAAAWVGSQLEQQHNPLMMDFALPLWITGGLIILLMNIHFSWSSLGQWWRDYQREIIAVLLITLFAGTLRFYQLDKIPNIIVGDEGWTGMAALKLLAFNTNPFAFAQGFGRPYLDMFAAAIDLFGRDKFGLRFIPALGGTLAIPATYLFARRLMGVRNAVIAALLLAVSHAHIHFSRTAAVGYQQSNWLIPLELYCLLRGLEERKRAWIAMSGLLLGVHFNVYFSAQIIIPMICVFLIMVAIISPPQTMDNEQRVGRTQLSLRENLRNLPWFFGSILVMAFPALAWAYHHPHEFGERFALEGSLQSGWLATEVVITGKPVFLILLERVGHVLMSIFILPFQDFYWAPAPVLDMMTAILFGIGVFLALLRTRDPRIMLLNGWFWSGVVAIGVFSIPATADSYRLLMVLPAICVLAALGWAYITSLAERLAKVELRMVILSSVILLALVAALNLKIYFIDFGRSCLYGGINYSTRRGSLLGDYLRVQPAFEQGYLLQTDNFYYPVHLSTDYLSGSIPLINLPSPFVGPDTRGSTIFIIPPLREYERVEVSRFAPGGQFTRVTDCGELMFLAYRVYIP